MPGAEAAIVQAEKVRDYLLARDHLVGRHKAVVFEWLGYRRERWPELQRDLSKAAVSDRAELQRTDTFGQVYRLAIMLRGPAGRVGSFVTIWIIVHGQKRPRLVPVFPGE